MNEELQPRKDNQEDGGDEELEDWSCCVPLECNCNIDAGIHSNSIISYAITDESLRQCVSFTVQKVF